MDYEEEERNWLPLVAAILLVLGIAGGGLYYILFGAKESPTPIAPPAEQPKVTQQPADSTTLPPSGIEETSAEILENLNVRVEAVRPEDVAATVAKIMETGDLDRASSALGGVGAGVSPEALKRLQAMAGENGFRLKQVREVGELEINRRKRFALEWEDGAEPLFLDMTRGANGQWSVDKVRLPEAALADMPATTPEGQPAPGGSPALGEKGPALTPAEEDSLSVSDSFLQAALSQDFSKAKSFANTEMVSDAKIAAMCILFEEGKYRLNPDKPLRAMFNRETTAGFLANVLTSEVDKPAQFGVNLMREKPTDPWKVTEINLDSLLADYATRVAGGDVYYTPLVPNPKGGETLVIFFGFDEETLAPRTQRQLAIVSDVLRTDPNRKLTLSGHADALGSDEYNRELSAKRAAAVRNYLIEQGVEASQIILVAEGESRPRRPNETETGEDNPEGRRANRRTEIYLDFGN
ncbi:OmpA family protein [Roseibacillus persicicus]|uniref:OmpA family protein n=1 Tax=Roseibacillus persicicus TaxID=454148 RepID=UPI00281043D1|nr:OmpA family protein [Roseibacillus persicicus]MDQ8191621.1 OmpA family protein [Roseibacillus persicicus]